MPSGVVLRDFGCAICGAPRTTLEDALVVLCLHCGGVLTSTGDGGAWHDVVERHADGLRMLVKPSQASARLLAVSLSMSKASERATWRLLCEEQNLLAPIVHSRYVAPLPAEPTARAAFVRDSVAMQEICTFDASVVALMNRYASIAGRLGTAGQDAVVTARAMLDAAREYYRALVAHPDLPSSRLREGTEHHAKELVRSALPAYAMFLGEGVIEEIRCTVLGDRRSASGAGCSKCGAALPLGLHQPLTKCPYCGAVTGVHPHDDISDAWSNAQLGIWKLSLRELVETDRLDGPTPVMAAVGGFLHTNASGVSIDRVVRFLGEAIPWVTLADLTYGLDLLEHAVSDDRAKRELLQGIREAVRRAWHSDPARRPVRSPRAEPHPTPTPADEAAWIESALALHSFRGPSLPLHELLAQPLSTMQVAAVRDEPTSVTPRAALTFFERAAPRFNRQKMRDELMRLRPGYDHPRVAAFIVELLDLL